MSSTTSNTRFLNRFNRSGSDNFLSKNINENNQAVDANVSNQEEPEVKDKQEVKKADDQEIENIQDEEGKNVEDQQFVFDPSDDQFAPTDRSDFTHEEFADELAHIISPPKYDCFYFRNLPDPGELMSILNSRIRENPPSTTCVNLPIEYDHFPLLEYVVWIFLGYLTYLVIPLYLHSFGNKDTIFDPCITINHFYSFKPGLSHRCGAFKKFNTHHSHLNEWLMIINGKNTHILDVHLFYFYPP
nr:hypothetical protein [Tanacetum cinerariifolium]